MVCEYMLSRSPFISRLAVYNPNEPDPSSTRIDITYKEEILSSESGVINYGDTEIQVKCTPMSSSKIDDSKRIPYKSSPLPSSHCPPPARPFRTARSCTT